MLAAPALTPLRPLASCSCPGAWCILLGGTSGSGALLTHRPQVWDPFPSARLGTDSLGDTDTPTRTETRGSERRRQAHTDTRSTHPWLSPTLLPSLNLFSGLFPLSLHPPSTKEPQTRSRQASTNTRKASLGSFKGKGQEQRWEAERVLPQRPWNINLSRLKTSSPLWPGAGSMTEVE